MGEAINLVNGFKVDKVIFNLGEYNYLELEFIKELEKKTGYQKYEQRSYDNLNHLYKNKK